MFHHDSRDYKQAVSEAAAKGRVKMEEIIHAGRANAEAVVSRVLGREIKDKVAPSARVRLDLGVDGDFRLSLPDDFHRLHPHAHGQLLDDVGVPKKFADKLAHEAGGKPWGKELVAHNVNTILGYRAQRNLIRVEDDVAMGWLSDKFRRLDSRPLVDAFCGACKEHGLLPIDGIASDTKCRVRAVLPMVFEPVENEVMLFGAEFGNSDYGDGGLVVNLWTMRVWCTNLAITEKCLRQVHLGSRLPVDLQLSDETYRQDARTTALAVRDVVGNVIAPWRINRMLEAIRSAGEKELQGRDGIDKVLAKASLTKTEADRIATIHESNDVVNLPPGNTVLRLSNAVSWFAQSKGVGPDRRLELQQLAGELIHPAAKTNKHSVKEV